MPVHTGCNYYNTTNLEEKSIERYTLWPAMDKNYVVCQTTATTCS
ncbi:hypothetical protein SAMN04488121_10130 [Chitinophaga filiformis]|uniref:Uncharacterized protein n=1 Tax=Chitinophaga filiformis TaxID=104663 RepID=A0A1G7GHZ0_CHIFI|nr:hypothetical protein SAMN04488121_10130 [Chitinophaga filiformis]